MKSCLRLWALAAVASASLLSSAKGEFIVALEAVNSAYAGITYDNATSLTVTNLAAAQGDVLTFNIYGIMTGTNGTITSDSLTGVGGGFVSTYSGNGGVTKGNLAPATLATGWNTLNIGWAPSGGQTETTAPSDTDGHLDIGAFGVPSGTTNANGAWFQAANTALQPMPSSQVAGSPITLGNGGVLVGQITYTITGGTSGVAGASTSIGFWPIADSYGHNYISSWPTVDEGNGEYDAHTSAKTLNSSLSGTNTLTVDGSVQKENYFANIPVVITQATSAGTASISTTYGGPYRILDGQTLSLPGTISNGVGATAGLDWAISASGSVPAGGTLTLSPTASGSNLSANTSANWQVGYSTTTPGAQTLTLQASGTDHGTSTLAVGSSQLMPITINGLQVSTYSTPTLGAPALTAGATSYLAGQTVSAPFTVNSTVAGGSDANTARVALTGLGLSSAGLVGGGSVSGSVTSGALTLGSNSIAGGTITVATNEAAGVDSTSYGSITVVGTSVTAGVGTAPGQGNGYGTILGATVPSGSSMANLTTSLTHANGSYFTNGTAAQIMASDNLTTAGSILMKWRNPTANELKTDGSGGVSRGYALASDVVNLTGVPVLSGSTTTTYALQMSYDPSQFAAGSEASLASSGFLYLAYLNNGTWVNATTANGSVGGSVQTNGGLGMQESWTTFAASPQGLAGHSLDSLLGSWGVDTATHTVWGIVSYDADFAVVPEPSTLALLAVGLGFAWYHRRSKKNSPA